MRTTYEIVATYEDFSRNDIEVKVIALADALALARGYLCATDATRVAVRHKEYGTMVEYKKT